MQFIVISHQLWEILLAVALGASLGFLYDLIRFIRRLIKPVGFEILFANIFDLIYLLFCGCSYCIFLYAVSNGRFRWFTLTGLLIGFYVYRLILSRIVKPVLFFIADKLNFLFSMVVFPIKKLFIFLIKGFTRMISALRRRILVIKTNRMKNRLCLEVKLSLYR